MPELVITISSAGKGATDLIIGNAIGSNICNLLLILGVTAMLRTIEIDKDTRRVHLPVALLSNIAILFMGLGFLGSKSNVISREDGRILIIFYSLYFLYPILVELKDIIISIKEERKNKTEKRSSFILSILTIIIGAILLKYGGDIVVEEASKIAAIYGISERVRTNYCSYRNSFARIDNFNNCKCQRRTGTSSREFNWFMHIEFVFNFRGRSHNYTTYFL